MKANLIDLSGSILEEIDLPPVFEEEYRPDLIKRAVLSLQASRRQPYGASRYAGIMASVESWGPGRAVSRVPRLKGGRRAAHIPGAVKGRRAHPPKPEKDYTRKINSRERNLAIRSAIAATANPELVRGRGHRFQCNLPVIVDDALDGLARTKDVVGFLQAAGLWEDVMRIKKRIRAGKGKMRGRKYKQGKSILIVTADKSEVHRGGSNIPGVDVVDVASLNAELLAPGTHAGRLTIWTQGAVKKLEERYI